MVLKNIASIEKLVCAPHGNNIIDIKIIDEINNNNEGQWHRDAATCSCSCSVAIDDAQ
jgi:hypothetical protein